MPLHTRIFIGLFIGLFAGFLCHSLAQDNEWIDLISTYAIAPIGQIFMRLIFMMILPLMTSSLILGVATLGLHHRMSSVTLKGITFALFMALCASVISLTIVNIIQPGKNIADKERALIIETLQLNAEDVHAVTPTSQKPITQRILGIIPRNPIKALSESFDTSSDSGGIMPVMFFSLLFGFGLAHCNKKKVAPLTRFFEALYEVSTQFLSKIMQLAPFAVGSLIFTNVNKFGFHLIWILGNYILVVFIGLLIQMFGVYPLVLRLGAKRSPFAFFKDIETVILTSFSTSSSSATLPTAIDTATNKLHLDRSISQFIITLGATANQNGSALYEGITVLFLAQLFGIDLGIYQQFTVLGMCIIASLGTAGVPGGTLPFMMSILITLGIPAEGMILVMGVERILDMMRTVINVVGDMVLACWVHSSEKLAQARKNS
jgi:dicarboxylate/amino acid:cation (Na+ or H+) symporter, DAACS family